MAILAPLQKEFLSAFFSSPLGNKFFLSGGTALAEFYLKHRVSQDLDFFTLDQNLDFDFVNAEINKIANALKLKTKHQVSSATFLQYIFQSKKETLKIDVVKDVPVHFGKIKKVKRLRIDSLENIAAGKLLAIFGRTDAKDFIDFYFLIKKKKLSFKTLFKKAKKKDLGLNEFYFANMLAEVENIEYFPKTLKPFDKEKLVNFCLKLSQKLLKEIKPKSGFSLIGVLLIISTLVLTAGGVVVWLLNFSIS